MEVDHLSKIGLAMDEQSFVLEEFESFHLRNHKNGLLSNFWESQVWKTILI